MTAERRGQKAKMECGDGIRWGHYPIKIFAAESMLAATML
jgi:hypothetical protein